MCVSTHICVYVCIDVDGDALAVKDMRDVHGQDSEQDDPPFVVCLQKRIELLGDDAESDGDDEEHKVAPLPDDSRPDSVSPAP